MALKEEWKQFDKQPREDEAEEGSSGGGPCRGAVRPAGVTLLFLQEGRSGGCRKSVRKQWPNSF